MSNEEYPILKAALADPEVKEEFRLELATGLAKLGMAGMKEYLDFLGDSVSVFPEKGSEKTAEAYEELTVKVGEAALTVEVADDERKRVRGLSGRDKLAEDRGMLFAPAGSYWMRGCTFDLDVMFIDKQAQVVDVQTMKCDEPGRIHSSRSDTPAVLAIEAPAGWCARNGVEVGDAIL